MSTTKPDDLDVVRIVFEAIKDFAPGDQQRILRWVAEKLELLQPFATTRPAAAPTPPTAATADPASQTPGTAPTAGTAVDIKTFIDGKRPSKDVQFAAAVAYYYRFEAPTAERKEVINKDDLQDAARKAGRTRFANPLNTLNNAHSLGLLDRGSEKGTFVINSVGENLIAMTLPGDGSKAPNQPRKKRASKPKSQQGSSAARKRSKVTKPKAPSKQPKKG